jgi:enoyl-CoA hydratase/carnithine racemase
MSDVVVRAHEQDNVGYILLDRPEVMNAITIEFSRQLEQALVRLAESVHVIVVRGSGGNFSVGGDFKELERLRAGGRQALTPLFENFGRACMVISTLPVPVIAAVEGYAMAGGFELMQSCDIVLVSENAKIADNHANFGQIPGGGGSQRLPRLVGRQRALGHILSGDRLSGAEAVAWGLAYRCLPVDGFDTAVQEFARRLASKSREAAARTKRLVYEAFRLPLEDGLALELRTVLEHLGSEGADVGIQTFIHKGA